MGIDNILIDQNTQNKFTISFQSPFARVRGNYGIYWRHKRAVITQNTWIIYLLRRVCQKIQFQRNREKNGKFDDNFNQFYVITIKLGIFHILIKIETKYAQLIYSSK